MVHNFIVLFFQIFNTLTRRRYNGLLKQVEIFICHTRYVFFRAYQMHCNNSMRVINL